MDKVWVVTIDTRRFFDDCECSFLPLMWTVFGVYSSEEKAKADVKDYFMRRFAGDYEYCFDKTDIDGNSLSYDEVFKRIDQNYGGVAYYGVDYYWEDIE
jgi:hypothetical protein